MLDLLIRTYIPAAMLVLVISGLAIWGVRWLASVAAPDQDR